MYVVKTKEYFSIVFLKLLCCFWHCLLLIIAWCVLGNLSFWQQAAQYAAAFYYLHLILLDPQRAGQAQAAEGKPWAFEVTVMPWG